MTLLHSQAVSSTVHTASHLGSMKSVSFCFQTRAGTSHVPHHFMIAEKKKRETVSQPGLAAAAEITPSGGGRQSGCEPAPPALHLKLVSLLQLAEHGAEGRLGLWEIQQSASPEWAQIVFFLPLGFVLSK